MMSSRPVARFLCSCGASGNGGLGGVGGVGGSGKIGGNGGKGTGVFGTSLKMSVKEALFGVQKD